MPFEPKPATYGRGGAGAQIWFGVVPCELGRILVATTPIGVCSVALGDDESALEAGLRAEFFAATIERDNARLAGQLRIVNQILEGATAAFDLPLDVRATAWASARLARTARNSRWSNAHLRANRGGSANADGLACRRARVRDQSGRARCAVPSRRARRRQFGGLPLGHRTQETLAGNGRTRQKWRIIALARRRYWCDNSQ